VRDVLGRHRTFGGEEGFEYETARRSNSQASLPQCLDRVSEIGEGQPGSIGREGHDICSVAQIPAHRPSEEVTGRLADIGCELPALEKD